MTENKKKNYVVIEQKMNYIKLKYNNLNYFNFQYGFRQLLTLEITNFKKTFNFNKNTYLYNY